MAGGEAAERLRAFDWAQTDLGPVETWPRTLVDYVALILELPSPAIIFWGPNQTQIYNDGYAQIMGSRHPRYYGAPYRECWPDTYPLMYPWMKEVLDHGDAVRVEKAHIPLKRYGFTEEAYFTFTLSPLRDDSGTIAGIYQPVNDVTQTVLAERRAETLHALAPRLDSDDPIRDAIEALSASAKDIPFALIFTADNARVELLAHTANVDRSARGVERIAALAERVVASGAAMKIDNADELLEADDLGPWPEPSRTAWILPMSVAMPGGPVGAIVLGISPRLHFDDDYRDFLDVVAGQVATTIAATRAARQLAALRKTAETQRERLHDLFMGAPAMICMLRGPDHVFELANPPYRRLVGDRELIGRPVREAIPEAADQGFFEVLDDVYRRGQPRSFSERLVRLQRTPGGELEDAYVNFAYQPSYDVDGNIDGVMAFAFDVTEQVRARHKIEAVMAELRESTARLQESEARFRQIVSQVDAGIARTDLSGRFTLVNERYATIVGRSIDELRTLRKQDLTHPDDLARSNEMFARMVADGTPYIIEKRYIRPDGSVVWVQNSVSRLDDADGKPHSAVAVTLDITDRKQADAEREAHIEELARTVRFSEMFVGILGHDLRNPLAAINMSAAALLRRAPADDKVVRPVERILSSVERMRRMIDQLLDFTRARLGGGIPIERRPTDLVQICRMAMDELSGDASGFAVRLDVNGDSTGQWDPDRLGQLISNLLGNALTYRPPDAPVALRLDGTDRSRVRIEVENQGAIREDILPVIFEPFRTSGGVGEQRSGLGLGLYISKQIALAHGGDITVRSSQAEGTCFCVDLPRG